MQSVRHAAALVLVFAVAAAVIPPARSQVKNLPFVPGDIVTVEYGTLEQVVRSAARFLSIFAEGASPRHLKNLLISNVLQDPMIYGSALAFFPGVTPFDFSSPVSYWNATDGVPMPDGTPFRHPLRLPNGKALYCPYAYRGVGWKPGDPVKSMDVSYSYDYSDKSVDWYTVPMQAFVQDSSLAQTGWWTDPFFDGGAGNISMATFTMPIGVTTNYSHVGAPYVNGLWFYAVITIDLSLSTILHRVPYQHEPALVQGVITSSVLTALATLGVLLVVVLHRNALPIKAGSPPFLAILLAGGVVLSVASIMFVLEPSDTNGVCQLRVVFTALGLVTVLAPLVARTYRIAKIFDNPKMKRVRVPDTHLARQVFILIFAECVLLGAWLFVGSGVAFTVEQPKIDSIYYSFPSCTESSVMLIVTMAYFAVLLVIAAYYSWRSRKAPTEFNESLHIAVCLMFMLFYGIVLVPLYYFVGSTNIELSTLMRSVGLLLGVWLMLTVLFGPKMLMLRAHLLGKLDVSYSADLTLPKATGSHRGSQSLRPPPRGSFSPQTHSSSPITAAGGSSRGSTTLLSQQSTASSSPNSETPTSL